MSEIDDSIGNKLWNNKRKDDKAVSKLDSFRNDKNGSHENDYHWLKEMYVLPFNSFSLNNDIQIIIYFFFYPNAKLAKEVAIRAMSMTMRINDLYYQFKRLNQNS